MRKIYLLMIVLSSLMLVSCGGKSSSKEGTITKEQVVDVLKSNADLGNFEFKISQNATHPNKAINFLMEKNGQIYTVTAKVKTNVDLANVSKQDVQISNDLGAIVLNLPQAKIESLDIVNDETGLKGSNNTNFFKDEYQTVLIEEGKKNICAQVDSLNLLRVAENATQTYLTAIFAQMGFNKNRITINFINSNNNE